MHIPADKILPQDKVLVVDTKTGDEHLWHVTDFKQAQENDPGRYALAGKRGDDKLAAAASISSARRPKKEDFDE